MTSTERRTGCIRMLAEIDQQISKYESLLCCASLDSEQAVTVAVRLIVHRRWRERIEKMLVRLEAIQ